MVSCRCFQGLVSFFFFFFFFLEELEIDEDMQCFLFSLEHPKEGPGPVGEIISAIALWFRVMQGQQAGWAKVWV